ncbi:hypothetical protein RhiJN_27386 [Ceratobasidium sp. AG-Ba]|nr:hypothetical protein RhiJN_27386 [Ceratobasidium sp. AG-Ba]
MVNLGLVGTVDLDIAVTTDLGIVVMVALGIAATMAHYSRDDGPRFSLDGGRRSRGGGRFSRDEYRKPSLSEGEEDQEDQTRAKDLGQLARISTTHGSFTKTVPERADVV